MKDYLKPFAIAFAACTLAFLMLDFSIMKLMGLTLFFHP